MTMLTMLAASPAFAHPPAESDHGVNATEFETLWSGDADPGALDSGSDASAMDLLANGTDVPLDEPPLAVEQWNRGDHRDFPTTTDDRSVYPSDASPEGGLYIEDAHATVFAVQPSTRVLFSQTDQPLYVAPSGRVFATVDYRVAVPEDTSAGSRHVSWRLVSGRIDETRLDVEGELEQRSAGTHRPDLQFSDLGASSGESHRLTVEADIAVELERTVRTSSRRCRTVNGSNTTSCRTVWDTSTSTASETVTVSDSVDVVLYDLSFSGFWARYPDGDLGLVAYKNAPWLGFSVPSGDVRGVWRFYSARDPSWDTLVTSTKNSSTTSHSPLHPLQVYAYPFEPGPTAVPSEHISILAAFGTETEPPALPTDVHLDALTEPYVASYGLATRVEKTDASYDDVTAYGLVRGVRATGQDDHFVEIPINRSALTLSVENTTDETVTVEVRLTDAETGEPINTADRAGYVLLADERVNTSGDGTVTRTIPREPGGITARFVPSPWWHQVQSYVGSSDVVYVRGGVEDALTSIFQAGVPVSLFLFAVFLIDRVTGWRIWPPWRGV